MQIRIFNDIILVGTAHVSPDSVKEVRETIARERPAVVAVELDERRAKALRKELDWEKKSLTTLLEGRNSYYFLSQALLAAFQRQMGKEFGAEPGSEMLEAMKVGKEVGAEVALVDRDITITLQKAWRLMRFREKLRLGGLLFSLMVPPPKLSKKEQAELEEMEREVKNLGTEAAAPGADLAKKKQHSAAKEKLAGIQRSLGIAPMDLKDMMKEDAINAMMQEMRRVAPTVARVLISERDTYMARKILDERKKGKVVAVVGAGYLSGLKKEIERGLKGEKLQSTKALERVPPKGFPWGKAIGWGLVIGVMALMLWGIWRGVAGGDWQAELARLGDLFFWWFVFHFILTGVAVLIARGHPLSALVGGAVAWFTALHPVLAAGWFSGYTEIKVRKLTNKHLVDVFRLDSWGAYFKNPVIRVLLVTVAGNIGSSIASFIWLPVLVRYAFGS